MVVFSLWLIC